ncbi:MAG: hypothetical protein AAGI17_05840, partial [Planctomycetota bacterium]
MQPDQAILDRNLAALARANPEAAQLIRSVSPRADIEFNEARDGAITGVIGGAAPTPQPDPNAFDLGFGDLIQPDQPAATPRRSFASRTAPLREAERLAEQIDPLEVAGASVLGFGLGHHCAAIANKIGKMGVTICFEPDIELLRAVFERIDHSTWIEKSNFVLLTDPDDVALLRRALEGNETVVALGVKIVSHPPSEARGGGLASRFSSKFVKI